MIDDVHQLRGIKLKGCKRDLNYFSRGHKAEPAHLEECFDADTLFYDIFFRADQSAYLVAVGPPLGNLQIALEVYVNGNPLKLNVLKRRHLQFVRAVAGFPLVSLRVLKRVHMHLVSGKVGRVEKQNDILIKANGQQWELSVPENNTGTKHKFTLCTNTKRQQRALDKRLDRALSENWSG